MILATHSVAGAVTAIILRKHPVLAFLAAFSSHFILDAIPHWDYKLDSQVDNPRSPFGRKFVFDKRFLNDILKTGIDFGLGSSLSLFIAGILFPDYLLITGMGSVAGALPDFLQLIYYLFPDSPLAYLQRFHFRIHAEKRLDGFPVIGIATQAVIVAVCIVILNYWCLDRF